MAAQLSVAQWHITPNLCLDFMDTQVLYSYFTLYLSEFLGAREGGEGGVSDLQIVGTSRWLPSWALEPNPVGWWACRTDKHSTVTMVNCAVLDFTFCNSAVAQKIK